jgi:hypothetical protein
LLPDIFSICGERHGVFRAFYDGENGFTDITFVPSSVVVVPEPSTTVLTMCGLVAVAAARHARKKKGEHPRKRSDA